jgi:pimeloyl-ACP methyl ester carboxylesterase
MTSIRFAAPMAETLRSSELLIFEGCAHAPLYENVQEFNEKTLQFLLRQAAAGTA